MQDSDKKLQRRSIFIIMLMLVAGSAKAATPEENLRTCLSGKYHSLCNYGALTPEQRGKAKEARRIENLSTCSSGKYPTLCNRSLLSSGALKQVIEAERLENLRTCMSGKYKTLCNHSLLSTPELNQVKEAERKENLSTCLNGAYPTLCNHSLLTDKERVEVNKAEKLAYKKAKRLQAARPAAPAKRTRDGYLIEVAHNDDLFIINGEKYEAQTYCLGWDEGEEVLFIEGSPYGACASAKLYNLDRRESCDVWCE